MASTPIPKRRADGSVVFKLPFRLSPGGRLTSETFDDHDDAVKFGKLVDKVGGMTAREIRTASTASALDVPTLETMLERHLVKLAASRTTGTIDGYRKMAQRTWLPALGDIPVDAITEDAVVKWVTAQRAAETQRSLAARTKAIAAQRKDPTVTIPAALTYAPKSIRNAQGLLSDVLKAALKAHFVIENVAYGLQIPTDHAHVEMVILTENEFVTLIGHIPAHYQPLVLTLYSTGLRWGEATALQVGDLDLDGPTPTLRVSRGWKKGATGVYLGSPKTRRALRTVSLGEQLVPVLRELCNGKKGDDLLFATPAGTRIRQNHFWERVWNPAVVAAALGKRPRVHDLRHTHASMMIAAGMNLLQLQYRLGHESLKTTGDVYGHLAPDALVAGARFATNALGAALPQIEA